MSSNVSRGTVRPFKAALLSLVLGPGAGQIYNGQKKKGYIILSIFFAVLGYLVYQIFSIYAVYYPSIAKGEVSAAVDFINAVWTGSDAASNSGFIGFLWLISIVDAYVSAEMMKRTASAAHNVEAGVNADENGSGADEEDKKDA
ncbi:MAG TPA: hypothetical protein PKK26_01025 [Candidatus Wallbacteria bacterium]|nr:hypothetical protein [Candidatus Wallbacteria bacterium]